MSSTATLVTGSDTLLEMRAIVKEFPGVKALQDVTISVRRGDVHAICGENGAGKSTLMKVLCGVYPHGTYEGEILLRGRAVRSSRTSTSREARGHRHHPPGARADPLPLDRREHLPRQRARSAAAASTGTRRTTRPRAAGAGRPAREPGHQDRRHRRRQAAAGRDREGALEERQAAHPRRADRRAQRRRLRAPARPDPSLQATRASRRSSSATSSTRSRRSPTRSRSSATAAPSRPSRCATDDVDEDRIIKGMVGRDLDEPLPRPHAARSARSCCGSSTGPCTTRWIRRARSSTTRPISSARGEIVGIAGLMGAGRTELAMSVFGRSYGANISGSVYKRGQPRSRRSTVAQAIEHGIAYVDRGPQALRAEPDRRHQAEHLDRRARQARQGRLGQRHEEPIVASEYRKSMNIKTPPVEAIDRQALRRQPAEGRALQVDVRRPRRAHPRRAHPRHRRRRQVRDLHDHQQLADEGKGVIVISSELPELLGLCDRIYTLGEGRITADVPRAEATARTSCNS